MTTTPAPPPEAAPRAAAPAELAARSGVRKRSLVIAGHSTSVSLEEAFWRALRDIAAARGLSVARLVADIDRRRGDANLSSAIRVFVLGELLARAGDGR
ncbi:ribbon-helix-helix domain-containing protein [Camelimonas abortus]|uniref:Ribbon-helix-helix domain-containing protein n=1 Tax=Camelimonas abortus TaxID=1017184 RepID=A0ABV7LI28_9HYPH